MPIGYDTLHTAARGRKTERDREKGKEIKRNEQIKMKSTINKNMKHDMPNKYKHEHAWHTYSFSFIHSIPTRFTLVLTKNVVSRMCVCVCTNICA